MILMIPFPWCPSSRVKYSILNRIKSTTYKLRHTLFHIPLNKDVCFQNLKDFKSVMQKHDIFFWISEGTALGAIRAHDFIDHDDDVDVGIWSSQLKKFEQYAIPDLKKMKFRVDAVEMNGTFMTISRSMEKMDIDVTGSDMKCTSGTTRYANTDKCNDIIPFLNDMSSILIRDELYNCPNIKYLRFLYGPDWCKPKRTK